jgi:hypothetical protein
VGRRTLVSVLSEMRKMKEVKAQGISVDHHLCEKLIVLFCEGWKNLLSVSYTGAQQTYVLFGRRLVIGRKGGVGSVGKLRCKW